jgi:hypothetical protein
MNIPYIVKCLETDSIEELVGNIDAAPLDMNLAIWEAIDEGFIEVDDDKGTIKLLKEPELSSDPELKNKILRTIQHYARDEVNITRGRLNSQVKDMSTGKGYAWHEYLIAVQHLIDGELIVADEVKVPQATKKFTDKKGRKKEKVIRPAHTFVFLGLAENAEKNEEWNARAVNKWIDEFEQAIVK